MGVKSSFSDKGNDISKYATKVIGTQTWMAENLNYNVAGAKCYVEGMSSFTESEIQANCDKYGMLYDWVTAMGLPASCNESECKGQIQAKHRGICPQGWHIPSKEEWTKLMDYVGGVSTAGTKLKSTSDWNDFMGESGNGSDTYGFSGLPGGRGELGGSSFNHIGKFGYWWSTSEFYSESNDNYNYAYALHLNYSYDRAESSHPNKAYPMSVRCIKD